MCSRMTLDPLLPAVQPPIHPMSIPYSRTKTPLAHPVPAELLASDPLDPLRPPPAALAEDQEHHGAEVTRGKLRWVLPRLHRATGGAVWKIRCI
jgi:hypothetical protein